VHSAGNPPHREHVERPLEPLQPGFPVQHAVAAVDAFPHAAGAQLGRGDRGLDGQAVQVLKVIVGCEPGMAAVCGVHGGLDLKVVDGPGHHAFLAVERLAGGMRINLACPGSSLSSAASWLLIGCDRGGSKDCSWQAPSLTTPACDRFWSFDPPDTPLGRLT
jgi:hypothetical protein